MREILFKAQQHSTGNWIESITLGHGTIKRKRHWLMMERSPDNWTRVKLETLCQFTGLTDKNGKKIFEGDKVSYQDWDIHTEDCYQNSGVVEWCEDTLGFYFSERNCVDMDEIDHEYTFVIGNIHDNDK